MRLTCPTCTARYEVADGMIAPRGQHVQCTACNTRWFERPPSAAAGAVGEDEIIARLEARGGRGRRPAPAEAAGPPQRETGGSFAREGRGDPEAAQEREPRAATAHLRLVKRGPETGGDEASRATVEDEPGELAEAEREGEAPAEAAREPEPPVEAPVSRPAPVPMPERDVPARPGSGRLDLERAAQRPYVPVASTAPERRRGAAVLAIAVVVLALLAAVYLAAEELGATVPWLDAPLDAYVDVVDAARSGVGLGASPTD